MNTQALKNGFFSNTSVYVIKEFMGLNPLFTISDILLFN